MQIVRTPRRGTKSHYEKGDNRLADHCNWSLSAFVRVAEVVRRMNRSVNGRNVTLPLCPVYLAGRYHIVLKRSRRSLLELDWLAEPVVALVTDVVSLESTKSLQYTRRWAPAHTCTQIHHTQTDTQT